MPVLSLVLLRTGNGSLKIEQDASASTSKKVPCQGSTDENGPREQQLTRIASNSTESLILAQNERWRRAFYMQVVRELRGLPRNFSGGRVSNA